MNYVQNPRRLQTEHTSVKYISFNCLDGQTWWQEEVNHTPIAVSQSKFFMWSDIENLDTTKIISLNAVEELK